MKNLALCVVGSVLFLLFPADGRELTGWARTLEEREFTRELDVRAGRLARGEESEWQALRRIWHVPTDGIVSTAFYASLGETLYRSPAMFLERHLAGDRDAAKMAACGFRFFYGEYAESNYGRRFSYSRTRSVILSYYTLRLKAASASEAPRIREFIHTLRQAPWPPQRGA